ncbi:MAG: protein translocase subunit SecF [Rickettsiales bacterium]|nr:protein translocase subunit SecF [Rickettsiales bacterium]
MLENKQIDFMKMHKIAFAFSAVLIVCSLFLIFSRGLNFGIDFSGGILIEARLQEKPNVAKLRKILSQKTKDTQIQNIGKNDLLIRVAKTDEDQATTVKKIQETLNKSHPDIIYRKIDYVGPQIGSELIKKGFLALGISFFFILIYIWVRFDWQFGIGSIIALIHDSLITFGFFALTNLEFNVTSIAAILTIIGYSINDSVVIYDRIRENVRKYKKVELKNIINSSLNSTLSRTILTSGVTLFSLLALILFGGKVLFSFAVATFFGIAIGTYSSIYIAAPMLLYCKFRQEKEN